MKVSDGMNYAPKGKAQPVVKPGECIFSAAHLDHGHIYGMTNGLLEAGGTLKYVYDPDPKKVEAFIKAYPQVKVARSEEELLNDKETNMVCGAAITNERCALGLRARRARTTSPTKRPSPPWSSWTAPRRWWRRRARSTWSITASGCMWKARCWRAT